MKYTMYNQLALIISLTIFAGGLILTEPRRVLGADPNDEAKIDSGLRQLAISLARALGDEEVRIVVDEALSKAPTFLSEIIDFQLKDGSLLGEHLAIFHQPAGDRTAALGELENLFQAMADVELSLLFGSETWDPMAQAPRVTYVAYSPAAEGAPRVELFDIHGDVSRIDPRVDPGFPVLALTYRDLSENLAWPEEEIRSLNQSALSARMLQQTAGCTDRKTYTSYPLFLFAEIRDIHEGRLNGPEGYAYFAAAGTEKTGNLPSSLGGESGWSTNVWASNFQGPVRIRKSRDQWEWTADGRVQSSSRRYPARYCKQTVKSTSQFSLKSYTIKEDDEGWNPDDYVGKVRIDHRACKRDVFDAGATRGWSDEYYLSGVGDVVGTRYKLYCTSTAATCKASEVCINGKVLSCTGNGPCSSGNCKSGPFWVECSGKRRHCPTGGKPSYP